MNTYVRTACLLIGTGILALLSACSENQQASTGGDHEQDWQHPVTPWGDPDLQGMWPVYHLITTPMQRPEQFGDRLYFTEEELARQRDVVDARNARYYAEDTEDSIGMGHWAEESAVPTQTSLITDPANGRFPEMTEIGKQMSAVLGSSWGRTVFDHYTDFDGWDRCISRGMPSSMFPYQYNNGIQIFQAPGHVVVNLEMIHEARIIPVDGRPALDPAIREYMGESRGHWEGNTLVVTTSNFNGMLSQTNAGVTGHPSGEHAASTEMIITERFERTGPDTMTYTVTVEDPVTLTQPWTATMPWRRDNDYEYFEYACHEDNYAVRNFIETSRYQRSVDSSN